MPDVAKDLLRSVGARIAELRRERNLTQDALSQKLEVSSKYLQRVEQGVENLTLRTLARFAEELAVAPIHLMLAPLAPRPKRAGRPSANDTPAPLAVRRVAPRPGARDVVPLYTLLAAAGTEGRADLAEIAEWVTVRGQKITSGCFVLRIVGDSMTPTLTDGSLVLFRAPVSEPDGKIVLVEVAEDGALPHYLVKKVAIDWRTQSEHGSVHAKLVSLNTKYSTRRVELSGGSGVRLVAEMLGPLATG